MTVCVTSELVVCIKWFGFTYLYWSRHEKRRGFHRKNCRPRETLPDAIVEIIVTKRSYSPFQSPRGIIRIGLMTYCLRHCVGFHSEASTSERLKCSTPQPCCPLSSASFWWPCVPVPRPSVVGSLIVRTRPCDDSLTVSLALSQFVTNRLLCFLCQLTKTINHLLLLKNLWCKD